MVMNLGKPQIVAEVTPVCVKFDMLFSDFALHICSCQI